MKVEYWSEYWDGWRLSGSDWTREEVAENNALVGWEMYREAE